MKPVWRYSLFGLLAYLLFIVVLLPADRVYALLQQRISLPLQLYQVNGSIWQGHIGMVRMAGIDVRNVDWCLHPWMLFRGRLEMGVTLTDVASPTGVVVGRTLAGNYYIRDNGEGLSLPVLESVFNERPFGLTGAVTLDLEEIAVAAQGRLQNISGRVQWQRAGLGEPLNISVGNFEVSFTTEDDTIQGALKDNGGPLRAEGLLMLLPDNSYRLTMTLEPRDKSRSDLKQALRLLGTPSPEGKVSLTRRGRLGNLSFLQR